MVVTFLTDFGVEDVYAGVCRTVVLGIAPDADLVDLTHGIAPQDVLGGALALADALPYAPAGVHLAVVDPGVGGSRRAVALAGEDGRLYVGPDNGLLLPAVEALGGVAEAVELTSPAHRLDPVSRTFHGRDVFAPAAGHLARGVALAELGPRLDPASLVRLDIPEAAVEPGRIRATVLSVDRYGNAGLDLRPADLERAGLAGPVRAGGEPALVAATYGDVAPGGLVLLEDSNGRVALARNGGRTGLARGDALEITR